MSQGEQLNQQTGGPDSARYLQWGTTVTKPEGEASSGRGRAGEVDDGRQYYTEYSQVSAIETGFKKLKSNQI